MRKPKPEDFGLRSKDGKIPAAPITPREFGEAVSRLVEAEVLRSRAMDFREKQAEWDWLRGSR